MTPRARPRGDDLNTQSTLAPLRWIAEEDLMHDATSRTLHRPACPRLRDATCVRSVPARSALELIWAPTICACGPDVTLSLSLG